MPFKPPAAPGAAAPGAGQVDLFGRPRPQAATASVLSVSQLTRELKGLLEPRFARVAVRGEISNWRPAASGHHYFTLKDEGACIAAVLFRADAARLKFALKDGLAVIARGRLSVYEARGQYQILCDALEPEGAGALALAFEQLKARLQKEGLFDPARKRSIPYLPRRIGVVTSTAGAALQDFLRVLNDRFPIPVLVAPARVQGEGAALEIARGIERLGRQAVDVIVVTRGGGSLEDLWAFNEEPVARAIAAARVPVISAVGHEVDFTIADFVADKRCATPTDAAKTLAPSREDLLRSLEQRRRHLRQATLRLLGAWRERLRARSGRLVDPRRRIATDRLALDHSADRMQAALGRRLGEREVKLESLSQRLQRAHPQRRLARSARLLTTQAQALSAAQRARLQAEAERLESLRRALWSASPAPHLARRGKSLAQLRERAEKALSRALAGHRVRLSRAAAGLNSLSPLEVLGRGYAIAFDGTGRVIKTAAQAPAGSRLSLLLADRSELDAEVLGEKPG